MNQPSLNPEARGAGFCLVVFKSNYCIQEGEDGQEQRGRIRPLLQSQIVPKITVLCWESPTTSSSVLPLLSVTKQETKVRGNIGEKAESKKKAGPLITS